MKQKKLTQKKKSELLSQTRMRPRLDLLGTRETDALPIIDTLAGAMVGEVVAEDEHTVRLQHVGVLSFRPESLKGGQQFVVKASLAHAVSFDHIYNLSKTAIRGWTWKTDAWLKELYQTYVARVTAGAFELNPFAEATEATLQQGDGAVEAPTVDVNTISAEPLPSEGLGCAGVGEPA